MSPPPSTAVPKPGGRLLNGPPTWTTARAPLNSALSPLPYNRAAPSSPEDFPDLWPFPPAQGGSSVHPIKPPVLGRTWKPSIHGIHQLQTHLTHLCRGQPSSRTLAGCVLPPGPFSSSAASPASQGRCFPGLPSLRPSASCGPGRRVSICCRDPAQRPVPTGCPFVSLTRNYVQVGCPGAFQDPCGATGTPSDFASCFSCCAVLQNQRSDPMVGHSSVFKENVPMFNTRIYIFNRVVGLNNLACH